MYEHTEKNNRVKMTQQCMSTGRYVNVTHVACRVDSNIVFLPCQYEINDYFCTVLTHIECVDVNCTDAPTIFNGYVKTKYQCDTYFYITMSGFPWC